jgi:hypothetical protein
MKQLQNPRNHALSIVYHRVPPIRSFSLEKIIGRCEVRCHPFLLSHASDDVVIKGSYTALTRLLLRQPILRERYQTYTVQPAMVMTNLRSVYQIGPCCIKNVIFFCPPVTQTRGIFLRRLLLTFFLPLGRECLGSYALVASKWTYCCTRIASP